MLGGDEYTGRSYSILVYVLHRTFSPIVGGIGEGGGGGGESFVSLTQQGYYYSSSSYNYY